MSLEQKLLEALHENGFPRTMEEIHRQALERRGYRFDVFGKVLPRVRRGRFQ